MAAVQNYDSGNINLPRRIVTGIKSYISNAVEKFNNLSRKEKAVLGSITFVILSACGGAAATLKNSAPSQEVKPAVTYYITPEPTKQPTLTPNPTVIPTIKPEATPSPVAAPIVATKAVSESRGGPGSSNPEGVKILNEALPYIRIVNAAYTTKLENGEVVHGVNNDYGESITIKGGNEKQIPFTIDTKMGQKYIAITNGEINKDSLFVKITTLGGDAEIDIKDKRVLSFDSFLREVKAQSELDKTLNGIRDLLKVGIEKNWGAITPFSSTYIYDSIGFIALSDQKSPTTSPSKGFSDIYSSVSPNVRGVMQEIKNNILGKDVYVLVSISRETSSQYYAKVKLNNNSSLEFFDSKVKELFPNAKDVRTIIQRDMTSNGILGFLPNTDGNITDTYIAITTLRTTSNTGIESNTVIFWRTSNEKSYWINGVTLPNRYPWPDNLISTTILTGNKTQGVMGGKTLPILISRELSKEGSPSRLEFDPDILRDLFKAML